LRRRLRRARPQRGVARSPVRARPRDRRASGPRAAAAGRAPTHGERARRARDHGDPRASRAARHQLRARHSAHRSGRTRRLRSCARRGARTGLIAMASRRIPIGQYGLIGDTRSAALVAPDGAIDWCCLPRFDSAPVFGRLVGGPEAGWFSVGPAEPASPPTRSYRDGATTLTTRWQLHGGEVELADTMVAIVSGRLLPAPLLVRQVTARGRAARVALQVVLRFGDRRSPARRTMHRQDALVFEHDDLAIAVAADADHLLLPDEPVEVVVDP